MSAARRPRILVVGSTMMDMTAYVDRVPAAGETVRGRSFALGFGGKGANQAVMAALLGADVVMVACVGDDVFGGTTVANLAAAGIDTRFVRTAPGVSTGVAPIWIDAEGENRIVIVPGANLELTVDDVDAAFADAGEVDLVICQLEIPLACVERAADCAAEAGAAMLLNPAPAAPLDAALLRKVSWLIPNEPELALLLGSGQQTPLESVSALAADLDIGIVVTLGAQGCALALRGRSELQLVAAPAVDVVDTSGAGDAFIGAFAFALAAGHEPVDAARFACTCASASVTRRGTQASFPRDEALQSVVAELTAPAA